MKCILLALVLIFSVSAQNIPGISVDVSLSGVEYIRKLAEKTFPLVFKNIRVVDYAAYGNQLTDLTITGTTTPKVDVSLSEGRGLRVYGIVESGNVTGKYKALWLERSGGLEIRNTTIDMVVSMIVGTSGYPRLRIQNCTITFGKTRVMTSSSWLEFALRKMSGYLGRKLGKVLCDLMEQTKESESSESTICGNDDAQYSNVGGKVRFPMQSFTINMSITRDANFYPNRAELGFNGTVLYLDHLSRRSWVAAKPQKHRPIGNKMLRIVVSSMVGNSFFSHVFAYSLGGIHKAWTTDSLPKLLRIPLQLICKGCTVRLDAGLSRAPIMLIKFGRRGIRINFNGWVRLYATALGRRFEIFWAYFLIRARAFPYVRRDRMHANTMIDHIYVSTNRRSGLLGKIFGVFLRDATRSMNQFVPFHLSKSVNSGLKKIFGRQGGIPLPQVCGIEFVNSHLFHINNAVIVDADVNYESTKLVQYFRKFIEYVP